jgi:hypothetical protein
MYIGSFERKIMANIAISDNGLLKARSPNLIGFPAPDLAKLFELA